MPRLSDNRVPSYRLHKQSGQAIVTLNGRDHLLGTHDTQASKEKYHRLIAEWIAGGRQPARRDESVTVTEVIAAYSGNTPRSTTAAPTAPRPGKSPASARR